MTLHAGASFSYFHSWSIKVVVYSFDSKLDRPLFQCSLKKKIKLHGGSIWRGALSLSTKKKVLPLQTPLSGCYVIWSHDSVCYTDIEISAPASDLTCFFHRISARDASLICSTAFPFVFIFLRRTARALFFYCRIYIDTYLSRLMLSYFLNKRRRKTPRSPASLACRSRLVFVSREITSDRATHICILTLSPRGGLHCVLNSLRLLNKRPSTLVPKQFAHTADCS